MTNDKKYIRLTKQCSDKKIKRNCTHLYKGLMAISITSIFLSCTASCKKDNSVTTGKIYDFYGENEFEIPFESNSYTKTDVLNFCTELSMNQMAKETKSAGYDVDLYDFDGVERMLITSKNGNIKSYFLIYDKTFSSVIGEGESNRFTLTNLSESIQTEDKQYTFLFPLHFADIKNQQNDAQGTKTYSKKLHCTFNEFSDFYKSTGKKDVSIDELNKTITFSCTKSLNQNGSNVNWSAGDILLSYTENDSGHYVNIKPKD